MKEPMCTHLLKVPGSSSYYFRRKIPQDLISHYKKAEIKKSLRTSDKREAERLARIEGTRLDDEFAAIRRIGALSTSKSIAHNLASNAIEPSNTISNFNDWLLASNEVSKQVTKQFSQPVAEGDVVELARRHLLTLRARRDFAAGTEFYDQFMSLVLSDLKMREEILRSGDIERFDSSTEPLWKSEAMRNAYTAFLRGRGPAVWSAQASASSTSPTERSVAGAAIKAQPSLIAIVDKWAEERKPNRKTVDMANRTVQRFREYVGNLSIGAITRLHVVQFKEKLLEVGQSPVNTNKHLTVVNTLLNYARDNAVIDSNPASGVSIKIAPKEKPRTSFDITALNAIFSSPVFIDGTRPLGAAGEAAFWLPLLALFTGARLEELGQLHPSDIAQESYSDEQGAICQAWVIRIKNSEDKGQEVKNVGSIRRIPVHEELIRLGFLDYAQDAKIGKRRRIFDKLVADKFGTETAQYSKWFGRYLRSVCKVQNTRMTFHSFRHTFKELCRLGEIEVGDVLTGHVSGNVGDKYGSDLYPLRPLVNGMKKYRVDGLNFKFKRLAP